MKLYRTRKGAVVERDGKYFALHEHDWDQLLNRDDLLELLRSASQLCPKPDPLAPVISQEVWASGVTYLRSKKARMEESKSAGGGDFYDRVYEAKRPELFYKAAGWRVVGSGGQVRIRSDSKWNVPEPELTLVLNARGEIIGYTVGNDMSSRDIEGENPLYLPQAKVYDGSAAIGPCLLITDQPLPPETEIILEIHRAGAEAFRASTQINQIKRSFGELAEYLFREMSFPHGAFLMTGTGIVPPDNFSLQSGDEVRVAIGPIGTLINPIA